MKLQLATLTIATLCLACQLAELRIEALRYLEMKAAAKVLDGVLHMRWPWKVSE